MFIVIPWAHEAHRKKLIRVNWGCFRLIKILWGSSESKLFRTYVIGTLEAYRDSLELIELIQRFQGASRKSRKLFGTYHD